MGMTTDRTGGSNWIFFVALPCNQLVLDGLDKLSFHAFHALSSHTEQCTAVDKSLPGPAGWEARTLPLTEDFNVKALVRFPVDIDLRLTQSTVFYIYTARLLATKLVVVENS